MTAQPTGNDVLMGGGSGVPTLPLGKKHQTAGERRGGRIVAGPESYHVAKPGKPGEDRVPQFYPSGDPILGVWVDVQTDQRDLSIEGDTGVRRVYIEGSLKADAYWSRRKAVVEAVKGADAKGLDIGGELYLTWTREVDTGAPSAALDWRATYVRPGNAALGVTDTQPAQAAPAPVQPTPVASAQPAATAALANLTPQQIQQLLAATGGQQQQPVNAPF